MAALGSARRRWGGVCARRHCRQRTSGISVCSWDGVACVVDRRHVFLPASWLAREYPAVQDLCAKIEERVRKSAEAAADTPWSRLAFFRVPDFCAMRQCFCGQTARLAAVTLQPLRPHGVVERTAHTASPVSAKTRCIASSTGVSLVRMTTIEQTLGNYQERIRPYTKRLDRGAVGTLFDGRSEQGRFVRRLEAELVQHVGGQPTITQRLLIDRAIKIQLQLGAFDDKLTAFFEGKGDSIWTLHDHRTYAGLCSQFRLCLRDLGIRGANGNARSSATFDEYWKDRERRDHAALGVPQPAAVAERAKTKQPKKPLPKSRRRPTGARQGRKAIQVPANPKPALGGLPGAPGAPLRGKPA
jgi:hypothetical protein